MHVARVVLITCAAVGFTLSVTTPALARSAPARRAPIASTFDAVRCAKPRGPSERRATGGRAFEEAGTCELTLGRNTAAIETFGAALAAAHARRDPAGAASALHGIGRARDARADYEGAYTAYRAAAVQARRAYRSGDARLARYLCDEGVADIDAVRFARARRELFAAEALAVRGGERFRRERARVEYEIAQYYDAIGESRHSSAWLTSSLRTASGAVAADDPDVVTTMQQLASEFSDLRQNDRALNLAFAAMHREGARQAAFEAATRAVERSTSAYRASRSPGDSARVERALAALVPFGAERESVTSDLRLLSRVYRRFHEYHLGMAFARTAVQIDDGFYGTNAPEEAISKTVLFWAQIDAHRYRDAERSIRDVVRVDRGAFGTRSANIASDYDALGTLYEDESAYREARFYYLEELAIARALRPFRPGQVSNAFASLADVDRELGNAAAAEDEYTKAYALRGHAYHDDYGALATTLESRGDAFLGEDRPARALEDYTAARDIRVKAFGADDPLVAETLRHIASAEMQVSAAGRVRALAVLRRALAIDIAAYGPRDLKMIVRPDNSWRLQILRHHRTDMTLVSTLMDVGRLYALDGDARLPLVEAIYETAGTLADPHSDDVSTLATIALRLEGVHERMGVYAKAIDDAKRAIALLDRSSPDEVVAPYLLYARALTNASRDEEADRAVERAAATAREAMGPDSLYVEVIDERLAWSALRRGDVERGRASYATALSIVQRQIERTVPFTSEGERLAHLDALGAIYERYYSFVREGALRDPRLAGDMYDTLLRTRGLVAKSMESVRAKVFASGDPGARRDLAELQTLNAQIAETTLGTAGAGVSARLDSEFAAREQRANDIETDLVRRVGALRGAGARERDAARWQDVRSALKPDEAAVEIVRFQQYDGTKWRWGDDSVYVALVITPGSPYPALVRLGSATDIEGPAQIAYDRFVGLDSDRRAYAATIESTVWTPIAAAIGAATREYLVPDGTLNRIAFDAVPLGGGALLGSRYDVHLVWSTKDIVGRAARPAAGANRDAVVIGDPRFDLDEPTQRAIAAGAPVAARPAAIARSDELRGAGPRGTALPPLRYTRTEAEAVSDLLRSSGYTGVRTYVGDDALEERLKSIRHPAILHIATHGFYISDAFANVPANDALMRSGLLFSGADRFWANGTTSAHIENGVFTGLEATGLDLFGTDLVVLSACGTGLGDVRFGEGVFGLTRAFHEAGASSMLVSLWKVDDAYTESLMRRFYTNVLRGDDKHAALRAAQHDVRADVIHDFGEDIPWLWAGFVLIGD